MARLLPRRWTTWLGLTLVVAGLALLGYVGWQMFVTNWISRREHADIVERLEEEWARDAASDASVGVDAGRADAILEVPRFGDDYQVPILEGVSDDALAAGIGHFPDSAGPGEQGNYALAGHRVTHGEPLRDMPDLEPGDELVVTTRDTVYTYELDTGGDDLTVSFTEGWVTASAPINPDEGEVGPAEGEDSLITLTTCSELFHTDGRLIAFGHLVSAEPRS